MCDVVDVGLVVSIDGIGTVSIVVVSTVVAVATKTIRGK